MRPPRNRKTRRFATSLQALRLRPSIPTTSTKRNRRLRSIALHRPVHRTGSPMLTPTSNLTGGSCRLRPSPLRRSPKHRRAPFPTPCRLRQRRHRLHRVPHRKPPSRKRQNVPRRRRQSHRAPRPRQSGRGRRRFRRRCNLQRHIRPRNCRNRRQLNRLPRHRRPRPPLLHRSSAPPTVRPRRYLHLHRALHPTLLRLHRLA